MSEGSLAGRVALITGASRGIGQAIAVAFAREGASIALAARNRTELEAVAVEAGQGGRTVVPLVCDVTDQGQIDRLAAETLARLGAVDVLVNSAGIAESHKFLGHPDDLWDRALQVNLTGVYRVCKAIAPGMTQRQWGRIINIASVAAKAGARYVAAYTASKHGVLGLTRALAVELAPYNVTVNAICPGYVDTPMTQRSIENIAARTGRTPAEARKALEGLNPQHRLIEPVEVAAVAVLLAGEAARGITGQAINVDGGSVMY